MKIDFTEMKAVKSTFHIILKIILRISVLSVNLFEFLLLSIEITAFLMLHSEKI